jgi:LuxR family maltose regulon positive regulatory protein
LLQRDLGDDAAARATLDRALRLARAQNFRQPFLQFGDDARDALAAHPARAGSDTHHFARELVRSFPASGPAARTGIFSAEALTDREIEVLRYLRDMLTAAEIGAEMFISVNTVKAHLKNIYRKLDVTSRRQAVARALDLGLLDSSA